MLRTLFTLTLLLSITSLYAQDWQTEPDRKSNAVLIETGLSQQEAYRAIKMNLIQQGYQIGYTDNEIIQTQPKFHNKIGYNSETVVIAVIDSIGAIELAIDETVDGYTQRIWYQRGGGRWKKHMTSLVNSIEQKQQVYYAIK